MGLILDSSILIAKERQGWPVSTLMDHLAATFGKVDVGLSVVTIAELSHGAFRAKTETLKQSRLHFIRRISEEIPTHPLTLEIAHEVGRIQGEQAAQGIALSFQDLSIGVTALKLGYSVATLNRRDFERIPGLSILERAMPTLDSGL